MTSDYSISLRQLIKGQQHLGMPGHRVTPGHLPKTWFEGLLCFAPISTRPCHGLPSRKWVLGSQLRGWLGQFEGASSVLTIERAKAAHAAQLPLTLPFPQAALLRAVLYTEKQSTHWPSRTSLTQPHTEHHLQSGQAWYHRTYLLWRIMGPCKLLGRPKALVSQSHCCVDDILAITTNHNKPRKYGSQEGN